MAKKFIDAEMLKEEIEQNWDMQDLYLPIHFFDKVDEMTAADVQEVKHGHWLYDDDMRRYCSQCGKNAMCVEFDCTKQVCTRYCPHCGARMGGDENEAN